MKEHWEPRSVQTEKGTVQLRGLPPLREQQSLNGLWEEGGQVPVYAGSAIPACTYRRNLTLPESWAGKVIRLAFLGVNDICDVYV
ncbi:MAG TPA: hypothetical protein PKE04_17010, partial [Clostridia bacterium]|nr:hypothetical protein [Clostridia bacterium]